MAHNTLEDFVQDLRRDAGLGAALDGALGGQTGEAACPAVAAFAQACGYQVDAEEVRALFQAAKAGEELDDTALEGVSGGAWIPGGSRDGIWKYI